MGPKFLMSLVFCTFIVISGCGTTNNASDERDKLVDQLDPANETGEQTNEELNNKLGYVHYTRDQLDQDQERNHALTIDRTKMANMITRVILRNEQFSEVATLVTDQEVLIAYQLTEELNHDIAADIAKKSAQSIVPGFFHVYVSDNATLINDIHSLHNSTTNRNYDNTINQIINEMKKSSQGMEK